MPRQALPKGLVRLNLYLPMRQEAGYDFLREKTEASSDSEVIRQALRYFEQFVMDQKHGIRLKAITGAGEEVLVLKRFQDLEVGENYTRQNIIVHKRTMERLERLRETMEAKDISEIFRCALRFYHRLVSLGVGGAKFSVVMPTGEEMNVRIWPHFG